jgi:hypothetical protein
MIKFRKRIIFLHVQKTGGTTLDFLLRAHFADTTKIQPVFKGDYSIFNGPNLPPYISGHFGYELAKENFSPAFFLTILRHPISRLISQYRSFKKPSNFDDNWREGVSEEHLEIMKFCHRASFEEFLECDHPLVLGHTDNVYLRCFSNHNVGCRLTSAKKNIRTIDFVGFYERWVSDVTDLCFKLGISPFEGALQVHLNKSEKYPATLTSQNKGLVYDRVGEDIELYHWALWQNFRSRSQLIREAVSP